MLKILIFIFFEILISSLAFGQGKTLLSSQEIESLKEWSDSTKKELDWLIEKYTNYN